MRARIITEDGRTVEGILVTPKNARIVNAFQHDVLNESTNQYFTCIEAAALVAYVMKLLEEPEETKKLVPGWNIPLIPEEEETNPAADGVLEESDLDTIVGTPITEVDMPF
jgi:hypothetical protein